MNDIPAFREEFFEFLAATVNIDSGTKTKIRNRYVLKFPDDFAAFLAANQMADTAANRARFVIYRQVQQMKDVYLAGSELENLAALPPPEELE